MSILNKFVIALFVLSISETKQNLPGTYSNAFGEKIIFHPDNTFKYTWHFDLMGSWCKGKWAMSGDTIKMSIIPVYDTLSETDTSGKFIKDTLILSNDETSERITIKNVIQLISSGGQNKKLPMTKLYIKKDKLLLIYDGKPKKTWAKGFLTNKKYPLWFVKDKE